MLRSVDLAVSPGLTFACLGRNGAGKTTTVRSLLGLLKPDGGELRVHGLDPKKMQSRFAGASATSRKIRCSSVG